MKKIILITLILFSAIISCEEDSNLSNKILGKWQLFMRINITSEVYYPDIEDQIIREFKKNGSHIKCDYQGDTISTCKYRLTDSTIILFGDDFEFEDQYWIIKDTLQIRYDGGFEFYDEYFLRI